MSEVCSKPFSYFDSSLTKMDRQKDITTVNQTSVFYGKFFQTTNAGLPNSDTKLAVLFLIL